MTCDESEQWVLLQLEKQLFGIPGRKIREMVPLPAVTRLPKAPDHVRGIINLRGQIIPVLDLRLRLGMPSRQQQRNEICAMMTQREQDHRNWLAELEASVREQKFKLAADPHQCKFGKWYYAYQTDDPFFRAFLNRFEWPHSRIHAIAVQVKELLCRNAEAALKLVGDSRRGTLQEMIQLFVQFPEEYAKVHSEIGVILEGGSGPMAVSVDSAVSMESIQRCDDEQTAVLKQFQGDLVVSIGRRKRNHDIVVLLDLSQFAQ